MCQWRVIDMLLANEQAVSQSVLLFWSHPTVAVKTLISRLRNKIPMNNKPVDDITVALSTFITSYNNKVLYLASKASAVLSALIETTFYIVFFSSNTFPSQISSLCFITSKASLHVHVLLNPPHFSVIKIWLGHSITLHFFFLASSWWHCWCALCKQRGIQMDIYL